MRWTSGGKYIKTVNTLEVERQVSASVGASIQCTVRSATMHPAYLFRDVGV